jgi:L-ascorbate metabolism protein UlaG (beta-lactamase superfamily)
MRSPSLHVTYIGGATALIEIGNLRLLTDPTFDQGGREYQTSAYALHKLQGPAIPVEALGQIDAVLLSHDHHFDNLDDSGRLLLTQASRVLTTEPGAARLGGRAEGLAAWQSADLPAGDGSLLRITATPARHGPAQADRGPVIGFVLTSLAAPESAIYLSGDTVWYEGVAEVARRFPVTIALLFMGAARVPAAGPWHLTFTAAEGVEAARAFSGATVVPLHFEGWTHFTETRMDIARAFREAELGHRLLWLQAGMRTALPWSGSGPPSG